jgi:hypothetical protein
MSNRIDNYRPIISNLVEEHWIRYHRGPTIRWLSHKSGINSTCTVHRILKELAEAGQIEYAGERGSTRRATPLWVREALAAAAP